jgi:energy-coupling factor transporter ATP-binding protein EcfA2
MDIGLKGNDFLSLKEFDLKSGDESNVVLLLGANKSGKTQALKLVYSFLSALYQGKVQSVIWKSYYNVFYRKLNKNYLSEHFFNYRKENPDCRMEIFLNDTKFKDSINFKWGMDNQGNLHPDITDLSKEETLKISKPTAISPNGFGDYYKGIFAADRFYGDIVVFSSFVSDFLSDIFVVGDAKKDNRFSSEINDLISVLNADFKVGDNRILIQEKNSEFPLENAASGLKTFAPLILAMKSGLIEDSLIVDEPEVSLHPAWVEVMAKLLHDISKKGVKVFIATHSDVFIEKMNWFLKHDEKFNLDVWKFERREDGNHARTLELEDREIPTVEYLDVYYNIVKGF